MESKIVSKSRTSLPFPKLMICNQETDNGLVVLFEDGGSLTGRGMVVRLGKNGHNKMGFYSPNWDIRQFVDFYDTLEISN